MKFDLTLNWQSVLTLAALLSSWTIPLLLDSLRRRRQSDIVRKSIALYLDSLEIKARLWLRFNFNQGVTLPKGRRSFEFTNKQNHDALEDLFRSSDLGNLEKEELLKFVQYFKALPEMRTQEEFQLYVKRVGDPSLRQVFKQGPYFQNVLKTTAKGMERSHRLAVRQARASVPRRR